jgi:hypothetical protein
MILGLDASTQTCGWAFSQSVFIIKDAGFIDISKFETNKEKGKFISNFFSKHPLFSSVNHINLEAALSGFSGGFSSQQVIIKLSRFNAVLEYILSEELKIPINLINVNTARKKVLGMARIKGLSGKELVKQELPKIIPNLSRFDVLNKKGNIDKRIEDIRDSIIMSLYD